MKTNGYYITNWIQKRYLFYVLITCFAITIPFAKINGAHFFLLSFDHKELHLLFTRFDMQELYLMPFVFIMLFLFIFFVTTLGGRVWCGWSCPQTIFRTMFRDIIQTRILKIYSNLKNKQKEPIGNTKRALAVLIWIFLSILIACNFAWFFVPPEDFFEYIKNPAEHKFLIGFVLFVAAWLVFDVCFLAERFCIYLCPYARVQSVMFDNDTIQVIYDENRGGKIYDKHVKLWKKPKIEGAECTGCEACVKICPTHIDIRKGMQLECINCLECADACSQTMDSLNLPSLISWTSKNAIINNQKVRYARFRTIAYCVALLVAATALTLMSGKKEHMLLNINRTSELYKISDEGDVQNYYTFLFQNIDNKEHSYYFDTNDTNLKIVRPTEPIEVKPGAKQRVIVAISSPKIFFSKEKDTPIAIQINAYANDDKDKVHVKRKTIFVYPKGE